MARNNLIPYSQRLKLIGRELRKNMTLPEILLWQQIRKRKLGVQFHRQVPMDYFVVDFYCHEIMLALEVDGSSHNIPGRAEYDTRRQKRLESFGVRFIRIPDRDVRHNMEGVLRYIKWKVDALVELDGIQQKRGG